MKWSGGSVGSGVWDFEGNMAMRPDRTRVVLGVDGGSTSTVCVCIEAPQSAYPTEWPPILGRAVADCSNRNSVGDESARDALERVLAGALMNARLCRSAVQAVCLAVSGIDTPDDEERLLSWVRDLFSSTVHIHVYNDAVAALASGTSGKLHGCVLVVGTGTVSFGFREDGRKARSSGYGPLLGDQGSGYAIASHALAAVMRAHDGRGPPTTLADAILNELHLKHLDNLISWAYADYSWARVAALVPIVKACAVAGDNVAKNVLDGAVQELALSIKAVVLKLELAGEDGRQPFPLVLVGGVLEKDDAFDLFEAVVACVSRSFPSVQAIRPQVEPAVGAALLAGMQLREASQKDLCCNGKMSPADALEELDV